jgi:hypothetical protein
VNPIDTLGVSSDVATVATSTEVTEVTRDGLESACTSRTATTTRQQGRSRAPTQRRGATGRPTCWPTGSRHRGLGRHSSAALAAQRGMVSQ